jgi:predicted nucleic acid-binding protein
MTVRCFVDASILLHARDPRDPLKQARAAEWLERLWQQRSGRTSMQVLGEFHVALTRKLAPGVPPDLAWDEVARYLAWSPQETNEALLRHAREIERRYHLAWWDCTVVAAALMQDCLILLGDELPEGMVFGTLAVRSPFSAVLGEAPAGYEIRGRRYDQNSGSDPDFHLRQQRAP